MERNETEIEQAQVTYLIHESDMARADRKYKLLWLTLSEVLAGIIIYGVFRVCRK